MMFKNTCKLSLANSATFWKICLYKIFVIGICALLLAPIFSSIINSLVAIKLEVFFVDYATHSAFSGLPVLFSHLFILIQTFIEAMLSLGFEKLIYVILVAFIVYPFLNNLSHIPTGEVMYNYMSSLSRMHFFSTYLSKLKVSIVYSLFRTLISAPLFFVFLIGLYKLLSLITIGGLVAVMLPFALLTYTIVTISFFKTAICNWCGLIVVHNCSVGYAFKKNFTITKRFFKTLSCTVAIVFLCVAFTMAFSAYFLVIILPITAFLLEVQGIISIFNNNGMKYYVDLDSIVSPATAEKTDSFSKTKNLI